MLEKLKNLLGFSFKEGYNFEEFLMGFEDGQKDAKIKHQRFHKGEDTYKQGYLTGFYNVRG